MENIIHERIRQDVTDNPVVLFMKGSPVFPQCGFSAAVVQMLSHLGVKFKGIDVLADPGICSSCSSRRASPSALKGPYYGDLASCDVGTEGQRVVDATHRLQAPSRTSDDKRSVADHAAENRLINVDALDLPSVHLDRMPGNQTGLIDDTPVSHSQFGRRPMDKCPESRRQRQ